MELNDQVLVCVDCQKEFTFTSGEQQFFDQKGFVSPPKRCKGCRETRRKTQGAGPVPARGGRGGGDVSEYRSPAFRGSDSGRGGGGGGGEGVGGGGRGRPAGGGGYGTPVETRPPRPRRAAPEAIAEYRAPSFSPRLVHAPMSAHEEIDEEADAIGNRLEKPTAPGGGGGGNGGYDGGGGGYDGDGTGGGGGGRAPAGGGRGARGASGGGGGATAGGGSGAGGRERERPPRAARTRPTHEITCDGCGQTSSVPFKPQPGRPVYCQDCYQSKKGGPSAPPATEGAG